MLRRRRRRGQLGAREVPSNKRGIEEEWDGRKALAKARQFREP